MGIKRPYWFLLVAGLAVQPGFAGKIHPRTIEDATRQGSTHVFVVLKDQPQAAIVRRWEGAAALRLSIAEGEVDRMAGQPMGGERALRDAVARRDAIVVEARRGAAREIQDALRLGQASMSARLAGLGARDIQAYSVVNMFAAEVPAGSLAALESDPEVDAVLPIEWHRGRLDVSVPAMGTQAFWDRNWTGGGQSVAVLDSGVRTSHPTFSSVDLVSYVSGRYASQGECFGDSIDSPQDMNGHGSHVAGIVAGQGSSAYTGYRGVARGVSGLYNLKVGFVQKQIQGRCSSGASSSTADMILAIGWALENTPVKIFNYSYGGDLEADDSPSARLVDYIADAYKVTMVIAAGNEGPNAYTVGSPGNAYNGITVANADVRRTVDRSDDTIAPSSSRGPLVGGRYKPDVIAPGSDIYSAAHNSDGFVAKTGTSMASPMVAGAAALIRQAGFTDPLTIKALLINTADGNGWNQATGWGYVNLSTAATRANAVTGSVGPSSTVFYRGRTNGTFKSTLVWNRHVQTLAADSATQFNDLDLFLYSALNNSLLDGSDEVKQNVEQVRASFSGDAVVKVKSGRFTGDNERYALALYDSGFSVVKAPALAVRCTPPGSIAPGSNFTLSCEASNGGGMDAFGVSGTPGLPDGFSGSSAQSFGTIAAGATVTRVFMLKAPATAGTFRGTVALASSSYGEAYTATADVSYTVSGATGPSLMLDATSATFEYRTGGSVPAAKTIRVLGGSFTATASGGAWLKVSPEQGTGSLEISVTPAGLSTGTYNGAVTVAVAGVANSPQTVSVRLTVSSPNSSTVAVSEKMMTRALAQGTGCPVPTAASGFIPTDKQAYLWFSVTGAAAGDRPSLEWLAPDGSQYQTGQWNAVTSAGDWCFWSGLDIADKAPATKPGTWTVKVNWNGTALFSLTFTISLPVNVENSLFTDALATGCTAPTGKTTFSTTDTRVYFWYLVSGAKTGDTASIKWYRPDGTVHRSASWSPVDSDGRWCFHDSVPVAGQEAAGFPGAWTAKVSWNNNLVLTASFTLAPPVVIERKLMARTVEEETCNEPDPVTSFVPWDPEAVMWVSVGKAKKGDTPSVEWYTPSGELWVSDRWEPLDSDGNWCLWSSIYLADHDAAKQLGEWKVKFYWNGNLMFTMPFNVVPVKVTQRMTAKSMEDTGSCTAPTPADKFLATDSRAYAWFNVQQAKTGDRPKLQWLTPSGTVYREMSFEPVGSDGDWCFWSWMAIADYTPATTPGTWNVKVFWNDIALFTMPFQIAAGQSGTNGMASARAESAPEGESRGGQSYTGPSPAAVPQEARPGGVSRGTGCRLNLNPRVDQ